jgi:hypothetical protein
VRITNDYVTHGASPSGILGQIDMIGISGPPYTLVAAADGEVIAVNDSRDDCGCDSAYGPCANAIRIMHANGEMARYLHIRKNSAMVTVGQMVQEGDPIAIEGDVGFTCGSGRDPVADICLASVPPGAGRCGPHLHWDVRRDSTGELLNPMICGIQGGVLVDGDEYFGNPCGTLSACLGVQIRSNEVHNGFGTFLVVQSEQSVTASTVTVSNFASLVYRAQDRIRLLPGFQAGAGNSYFRGEIGACNVTAPSP